MQHIQPRYDVVNVKHICLMLYEIGLSGRNHRITQNKQALIAQRNILQHPYRFTHMGFSRPQNANIDPVPAFSTHKTTEAHHNTSYSTDVSTFGHFQNISPAKERARIGRMIQRRRGKKIKMKASDASENHCYLHVTHIIFTPTSMNINVCKQFGLVVTH